MGKATNIRFHDGMVPRATKEALLNQRGVIVWFTGGRGQRGQALPRWLEVWVLYHCSLPLLPPSSPSAVNPLQD